MKDSASSWGKRWIVLIGIISIGICVPFWLAVNVFIKTTTDELVNSWYQAEIANIQQGNMLSSITKLQRSLETSALIKAVKALDTNDRELINFQTRNNSLTWPELTHIGRPSPLLAADVNFYTRVYSFSSGKVSVFILTGSKLSVYLLVGISMYIVAILFLFGIVVRRGAEAELKTASQMASLAAQVSHDIRSPLAALNSIVSSLDEVSKEKRTLIRNATQRINDIANNLLTTSKKNYQQENTTQLLVPVIDEIVSEKRMEYRERSDVEVTIEAREAIGTFVSLNASELKSTLSSLITNAVEASKGSRLRVQVKLKAQEDNFIDVKVIDNGAGIASEVLEKLGTKGISFGKENTHSGSGLGVYHAKSFAERLGGKLAIETVNFGEETGSTFTLRLPVAHRPAWFTEFISLDKDSTVVSLDDDHSIGQLWLNRIKEFNLAAQVTISYLSFHSVADFEKLMVQGNYVYLIDYEFSENVNGIELIKKFNLKNAILVTSHFEDPEVQKQCTSLGIQLLPKMLIPYVEFKLTKHSSGYDAILIDDEKLIRTLWLAKARELNKKIVVYDSIDAFKREAFTLNKDATIFLDSSLGVDESGNRIQGEAFVPYIHGLGFTNIYMATGHEPEKFAHVKNLKGVVGKTPRFS